MDSAGSANGPSVHTTSVNGTRAASPYDRIGGRRFLLVLICALSYTALLVGGYLDPASYVTLQMMTVGAYIAGNVAQKYTEAKFNGNGPTHKAG